MHSSSLRSPLILVLGAAMLPALASGCGSSSQAYTPSSASAREALDTALKAWQSGAKPEGIKAGDSSVSASDYQWQAGQALESYQIAEEVPGEGDNVRQFSVRLKLKGASSEQAVKYYLIGRDPVWIYRDQDYQRLVNMDNNPRPARTAARGRR